MARLPVVDGDEDNWGSIIREFLLVEHDTDGTLKRLNQASGICPLDSNSLVPSANLGLKGGYSAIVYIDGSSVIARDYKGDLISSGTAGTDDATVINNAINSLSDYGIVLLLEKTFTLSSSIIPKSNIWLKCAGFATVLKIADGANCHAIMLTDVSNVILSGFLIDGNKANQTVDVHGIRIYADTQDNENIILSNIMVKDVKGHGIVLTGSGSYYNLNCIAGNIIALDNDDYGISYYYVKQGHMLSLIHI